MKLTGLLLALLFNANSFGADVFRVAVPFLPDEIRPRDGQLNIGQYLSLHLFYPLVSEKTQGEWTSEFLDKDSTKALSVEFKEFKMCLLKNLLFSDNTRISSADLKSSLERFHSINEQAPKLNSVIVEDANCILLKLNEKSPRYFSSLQGTSSTVLKTISEYNSVPIGMGPYRIKSYTQNNAKLVAARGKKFRFDEIIFSKVGSKGFNPSDFEDINPVRNFFAELPKESLFNFREVSLQTYKTYALVVSSLNGKFRNCVASNTDVLRLVSAYNLSLRDIPGFLPQGISGYNVKYVKPKNCTMSDAFEKIEMVIPYEAQFERITKEKKEIFGKMSKYISLVLLDPTLMSKRIFLKKPYISILGFDTSGTNSAFSSEASVYFESFYRENRILIQPIEEIENLISEVSSVFSKERRVAIFQKAHQKVLSSGYIIPMGESTSMQLFPKYLMEVVIADPISGYPQIDKIK